MPIKHSMFFSNLYGFWDPPNFDAMSAYTQDGLEPAQFWQVNPWCNRRERESQRHHTGPIGTLQIGEKQHC